MADASSALPEDPPPRPQFSAADIGALAHLYRGEMYRSKIWRSRLDATTNWAVVTTGIALSATFADEHASPLPLVLVGLLVLTFLVFEGRRYRFFDIWRVRVRVMETSFYRPILLGQGVRTDNRWNEILADDYTGLRYHISLAEAVGRRLRRNYGWIFLIQFVAYLGKLVVHPTAVESVDQLFARAAIGPIPGEAVLLMGVCFHGGLALFAVLTIRHSKAVGRAFRPKFGDEEIVRLASTENRADREH
jgi:uncharacterized membrane protein